MASRLAALLPRLLALTIIWLLGAAGYTLAAGGSAGTKTSAPKPQAEPPQTLVVPEVRRQPYIFAKGLLEDAGFAWRVEGDVQGFAANTVAVQNPAPGTKVIDNGAPTVVLRLRRNAKYAERGLPENESPYAGTAVVLPSERKKPVTRTPPQEPPAEEQAEEEQAPPEAEKTRKPDFVVPGAPAEPADEMPLPARARLLAKRLAAADKPTPRLIRHWLYQHSWIVYGARFGWQDGAEALRILIAVDESLQKRWDVGARSEVLARRALAEVESKLRN
jgi:hypothetical protein